MYDHFLPFVEDLVRDPAIRPKFAKANIAFRVTYTDPVSVMVLDATHDPALNIVGEAAESHPVEVELSMSADDGHRFWMGNLNLPLALARKKVKISGSVTKLLGLLPAMAPGYAKYRAYVEAHPLQVAP
ncbi:SCP2 sterol-binding domain-containing protein [Mycobacterium syngnathidarum]